MQFSNIRFGTSGLWHIRAADGAEIMATGNYAITGGASQHYSVAGAGIIRAQSLTITVTGTPAFTSSFANVGTLALALINGNTYSGAATGTRYALGSNGVIFTNGGGASYLPGSVDGTTASGGQYV